MLIVAEGKMRVNKAKCSTNSDDMRGKRGRKEGREEGRREERKEGRKE